MADEELESFARLNVASEQVNLYFLLGPVPLQSIQVFSLENLPIQISTEVSQYISYSRKSSHLKVFSLARDAEFGRFVVANKDLGVGDTVMEVAGLVKKIEWTAFCGLCGLTKPKAMEWTVIGGLFGLTKEMEWTAFCGLTFEEDWVNCNFVQERPLSWAPMLDSPPICLNCAKFLQKKSYRFHEWMSYPRLSMENSYYVYIQVSCMWLAHVQQQVR